MGLDELLDYVLVCLRCFCVKWLLIVNQIIEVRGGRHRLLPASTPARGDYVTQILLVILYNFFFEKMFNYLFLFQIK